MWKGIVYTYLIQDREDFQMKVLRTVESNSFGETVKVVVSEGPKGVIVTIDGSAVDVSVNGEVYYAGYDDENYKYVFPKLRPFIKTYMDNESLLKEKSSVTTTLTILGHEYFMELSTPRTKEPKLKLVNWLNVPDKMEDLEGETKEQAYHLFDELKESVKNLGYRLDFSHGNRYEVDDYYQLVVPIETFDENTILKALSLWAEYNEKTNNLLKD